MARRDQAPCSPFRPPPGAEAGDRRHPNMVDSLVEMLRRSLGPGVRSRPNEFEANLPPTRRRPNQLELAL